jgi:hypothetical protein
VLSPNCFARRLNAATLGYGVGEGDAAGEEDDEASVSVFFLVEVFLVVDAFFMLVSFFAPASFFVVASVELDIVLLVVDSFLLAHDVIKPTTARSATDVIRDCFIRYS